MKSIDRCKETFHGDRCKLASGHNPDSEPHAGNFTVWNAAGVLGKSIGAEIRRPRDRSANRAFRVLTSVDGPPGIQRKAVIEDLGKLLKWYGGVK